MLLLTVKSTVDVTVSIPSGRWCVCAGSGSPGRSIYPNLMNDSALACGATCTEYPACTLSGPVSVVDTGRVALLLQWQWKRIHWPFALSSSRLGATRANAASFCRCLRAHRQADWVLAQSSTPGRSVEFEKQSP